MQDRVGNECLENGNRIISCFNLLVHSIASAEMTSRAEFLAKTNYQQEIKTEQKIVF